MDEELEIALETVRRAGYKVIKPKAKKKTNGALNAIGKPYGENYDPNYRMKYRTSLAFLCKPMPASTKWVNT